MQIFQSSVLKKLLVWIFFLVTFFWLLKALFLGLYPDFSVYYYGSKLLLMGKDPYSAGIKLYAGYSYPPIVLLLFLPILILPFKTAEVFWVVLNFIFLLTSLIFMAKIFKINFFSKLNLLLMSLVFVSFPVKFTFGMGQINFLILLLLVYGFFLLKQKKEFSAGIFFGASLLIKLFPILLPIYFVLRLNTKIILGMVTSLIVSIILVVLYIPQQIYFHFIFGELPSFLISSWKLQYYSQSTSAFIGRTFGTGEVGSFLKIVLSFAIVLFVFFAFLTNKKRDFDNLSLEFGTVITASVLVNTFSWQHHFVWVIVPFYAVLFYLKKYNFGKKYFAILCISYIFVAINFPNPNILPLLLQSHVFFGALILFILQLRLLFFRKSLYGFKQNLS